MPTTKEVKRPRGRPPTKEGATPSKIRSAKSKNALLASGGRRLNTNLSPEATKALQKIKDVRGHETDRAGVEDALTTLARKL